jgi:hypothetical protein
MQGGLFLCVVSRPRLCKQMTALRTKGLLVATSLLLASCGPADTDPGPGGVTSADAEALDKAAQKLDERDQAAAKETEK